MVNLSLENEEPMIFTALCYIMEQNGVLLTYIGEKQA